jgi:DNA-3-methyladenine glycosylase
MKALPPDFYDRPVVEVARELIGCTVEHGGASGVIVETEAYHECEPACHAFVGLTPRTATLFGEPGHAYIYRSYGIHALLNAVCERSGTGAAVLIRALEPKTGIDAMRARRGPIGDRAPRGDELCSGPGKLTQALGIWLEENGASLRRGPVRIGERAPGWHEPEVLVGSRIGINVAVELPWRFCVAGNENVSRPRPLADRRMPRARRAGEALD